jgi:hypothetical protein
MAPPKFIMEMEGPFLSNEELVSVVSQFHEYDNYGIMVEDKVVRPPQPDRTDCMLYYEIIGKKIYRH